MKKIITICFASGLLISCGEGAIPVDENGNPIVTTDVQSGSGLEPESLAALPTGIAENTEATLIVDNDVGKDSIFIGNLPSVANETTQNSTDLTPDDSEKDDSENELDIDQLITISESGFAAESLEETEASNARANALTSEPDSVDRSTETEPAENTDSNQPSPEIPEIQQTSEAAPNAEPPVIASEENPETDEVKPSQTESEESPVVIANESIATDNDEDSVAPTEEPVPASMPESPPPAVASLGEHDGNTPNGGNYEDLLDSPARFGFGANATGGFGGELCLVTNLDDSGAGTLRDCVEKSGTHWIRFEVSGTITTSGFIYLKSNKTIDGRGADITLTGEQGLICFGRENIIIHNIKIRNIGSGIKFRDGCKNIWVDHVEISGSADEGFSADKASTDITYSWVYAHDTTKGMLFGSAPDQVESKNTRVTVHHSWLAADQRNPNCRYASVHVFNNIIDGFKWEGMVGSQEARIISQNNIFKPHQDWQNRDGAQIAEAHNFGDDTHGYIWSEGDVLEDGMSGRGPGLNSDESLKFNIPYDYTLETPDDAMRSKIKEKAGWYSS